MTNLDYFTFSAEHPEPLPDPFYKDERGMVIPPTVDESNLLTERNARLLELVSAFHVLDATKPEDDNPHIEAIVDEVRDILDETPNINFSAVTQFFLFYNVSHDTYLTLDPNAKTSFLKDILRRYCAERHPIYLSHSYSNTILQVVSDNYTHKRKSKATINKILSMLEPYGFTKLTNRNFDIGGRIFLLPDKGDKDLFASFRERFSIALSSAATEQGKLPDMVLGLNDEWFIVEMKNINGSGGGQDKQMTEIINFIRFSETDSNVHYLVFLDGEYSNRLFSQGDYINESSARKKPPKIQRQYNDIKDCLMKNPGNLFVNTEGFRRFLSDKCSPRIS